MNIELKPRLSKLMKDFDKKKETEKQEQIKKTTEEDVFEEEFLRVSTEVIKPVMNEIIDVLISNGHQAKLLESKPSSSEDKHTKSYSISLEFLPKGTKPAHYPNDRWAHLSFSTIQYRKKVLIHQNTIIPGGSGIAGSIGQVNNSEITVVLVETKVLNMIEKVTNKGF